MISIIKKYKSLALIAIIVFTLAFSGNPIFSKAISENKITASDADANAYFGSTASISGNYAIVGAFGDDDNGMFAGAAYVLQNNSGTWSQLKKLTASDGASPDFFGGSVSISGDYAVVGARWNNSQTGAVYVFYKDQGGVDNWGEVTKLTASDGTNGDIFGQSSSISGDYIIVGAEDDDTGSAYVFYKDQGGVDNWGEVTKLTASDGVTGDKFGGSVSISGDYAVIGAREEDDNGSNSGAAYVFYKDQGGVDNWGEVTKLTASDGVTGDVFGGSTSISGNYAIIGAEGNDDNGSFSGSAYVFYKDQGGVDNWGEVTKLTASDGASTDYFGRYVSISGDYAVIGAHQDDDNGSQSGSAYVFYKDQGGVDNWGEMTKLTSNDGTSDDNFAVSSISGNYILIGAPGDNHSGNFSGSAYVFSAFLCGNGTIDPGEACDDNNSTNNDGCSDICEIENLCGNGTCEVFENASTCLSDCTNQCIENAACTIDSNCASGTCEPSAFTVEFLDNFNGPAYSGNWTTSVDNGGFSTIMESGENRTVANPDQLTYQLPNSLTVVGEKIEIRLFVGNVTNANDAYITIQDELPLFYPKGMWLDNAFSGDDPWKWRNRFCSIGGSSMGCEAGIIKSSNYWLDITFEIVENGGFKGVQVTAQGPLNTQVYPPAHSSSELQYTPEIKSIDLNFKGSDLWIDYIQINSVDSLACSCNYSCGNRFLEILAGETCDDGNTNDGDGCDSVCGASSSTGGGGKQQCTAQAVKLNLPSELPISVIGGNPVVNLSWSGVQDINTETKVNIIMNYLNTNPKIGADGKDVLNVFTTFIREKILENNDLADSYYEKIDNMNLNDLSNCNCNKIQARAMLEIITDIRISTSLRKSLDEIIVSFVNDLLSLEQTLKETGSSETPFTNFYKGYFSDIETGGVIKIYRNGRLINTETNANNTSFSDIDIPANTSNQVKNLSYNIVNETNCGSAIGSTGKATINPIVKKGTEIDVTLDLKIKVKNAYDQIIMEKIHESIESKGLELSKSFLDKNSISELSADERAMLLKANQEDFSKWSHSANIIVEILKENELVTSVYARTNIFGEAEVPIGILLAETEYDINIKLADIKYVLAKRATLKINNAKPNNGSYEATIVLEFDRHFRHGNFDDSDNKINKSDLITWGNYLQNNPELWYDVNIDGINGINLLDVITLQKNWGKQVSTDIEDSQISLMKLLEIFGLSLSKEFVGESGIETPNWINYVYQSCN